MKDAIIYQNIAKVLDRMMTEEIFKIMVHSRPKNTQTILSEVNEICIRTEKAASRIAVCLVDLKTNKTNLSDISLKDMFMQLGSLENSVKNGISAQSKMFLDAVKFLPDEPICDFTRLQLEKLRLVLSKIIYKDPNPLKSKAASEIEKRISTCSHQNLKDLYSLIELENNISAHNATYAENHPLREKETDECRQKNEVLTEIQPYMMNPDSVFLNNLSEYLKSHQTPRNPSGDKVDVVKTALNPHSLDDVSKHHVDNSFLVKAIPTLSEMKGICRENKAALDNLMTSFVGERYVSYHKGLDGLLGAVSKEKRCEACSLFEDYTKDMMIMALSFDHDILKQQLPLLSEKFTDKISNFITVDQIAATQIKNFEKSMCISRQKYDRSNERERGMQILR